MGRAHLLVGAGVAFTAFAFIGCASKPKPVARQDQRQHLNNQGDEAPVARGKSHGLKPADGVGADEPAASAGEVTPHSMAQHAQVYAQNLESLLAKRAGGAAPAPAAATQPVAPVQDAGASANAVVKVEPAPAAAKAPADAKPQAADDGAQQAGLRSPVKAPVTVAPVTDALAQKLATRAKEYPRDVAAQMEYQLLQFLRDEPVPDLSGVAPLPAEDRELLTALLDGLSNFRGALRADANMLLSKKVAPLLEMGDRLRGLGELTIPAAALCTKVDRFGVYEPMEPPHLKAGTNNEAILYCEVANFSSQLNTGRQWETRLKHEAVLFNETGLNVWTVKGEPVSDVSRNRRHDFYVVKKLRVPPMPIGRYLLKVTVTDLQINRVAEATIPLQVVAQ